MVRKKRMESINLGRSHIHMHRIRKEQGTQIQPHALHDLFYKVNNNCASLKVILLAPKTKNIFTAIAFFTML